MSNLGQGRIKRREVNISYDSIQQRHYPVILITYVPGNVVIQTYAPDVVRERDC